LRWQNYSDATVARNKQRMTFCEPDGDEARLEPPHQELSSPVPSSATIPPAILMPADATAARVAAPECGHLAKARFRARMRLNKQVSDKGAWHEKRGRHRRDVH
jgi:hypothetical protein